MLPHHTAAISSHRCRSAVPPRYINTSGCITVPEIDDVGDFAEVQTALNQLGFTVTEKGWLFQLTAAVLQLGNVEFKTDDDQGSLIKNVDSLQEVADLFQVGDDGMMGWWDGGRLQR